MKSADDLEYFSFEEYKKAAEHLELFGWGLLFQFGMKSQELKDVIIRNFTARSIVSLAGVFGLWEMGNYTDCYSLMRCLVDRLFHLRVLEKEKSYGEILLIKYNSFEYQLENQSETWLITLDHFNDLIHQTFDGTPPSYIEDFLNEKE